MSSGTGKIEKRRKRWVVKLGSSLLTADGLGLDLAAIALWVQQIAQLRADGTDVVIVSSGSIVEGISRLGWESRPTELHNLQAAAAVGQMGLVQAWEAHFRSHDARTAQVLLVGEDMANRERYLNARKTLNTLLKLQVVPIVNENDTVATEEICFGDNDSLAAVVANLIDADRLVIMTDQQGLFDKDPRQSSDASLIERAATNDVRLLGFAGSGSKGALGRGGMKTKILAARQAATSGTDTCIVNGRVESVLLRLAAGHPEGTYLSADRKPAAARKQWIVGQSQTKGRLTLDAGAVRVITEEGRSLLPIGVAQMQGVFSCGDVVSCFTVDGLEVARGLVNYSSSDVAQIIGLSSRSAALKLSQPRDQELIHRDNLVIL